MSTAGPVNQDGRDSEEISPQEKRASLLSHLLALRKVLIICAAAIAAAFSIS